MKTGKIMILESIQASNKKTKHILRSWGHEVVQYPCNEYIRHYALIEKPDLILIQTSSEFFVEIFQYTRQLKEDPQRIKVPILLQLQKKEFLDKRELFYQIGIEECILDPVNEAELKKKVSDWLNHKELEEKLEQSHRALQESMQKINRQKAEIDHHLTLAARIQEALIPQNIIQVPNCTFYSHFQPSGKVGGDIYDIFMLDQEHMGLYIVDVMGHGVASSMLSVALSELLVPDVSRGTPLKKELEYPPYYEIVSPMNVIQYLNKRFTFSKYQHYFTFFYMVLNIHTGILRYCRAAHPEPILFRRSGEIETLSAYGTPIGFEFSQEYEEGCIHLFSGDRLLVYSDGLLELEDEKKQLIDHDTMLLRLENYQKSNTQRPVTLFFKKLAEQQVELKDDLTMVEMVWEPQK